jgi:hypothetical protein
MELLLLGTAHFESTGDYAQLSEEQKQNLQDEQFEKLVETLIDFKPTQIFVEQELDDQSQLHRLYETNDVPESFKLNEIYRIAFPLARKLNLPTVHAVDWNKQIEGIPNLDEIVEGPDQEAIQEIITKYNDKLNLFENEHICKDLIAYFRYLNSEETIALMHTVYVEMMTASDEAFEWVVRYWYYRNLKIVQQLKRVCLPETERAVLLIGGGHNYLVRQQLQDDPRITVITYDEWMNK